ncbi:hypothetical protein E2C01_082103 [Portunus trituberculatus]|uniref:Uncharacterized protein n=1 Tax=Portunus trituberculatus TaxID=210409 RepID=A0A5B7J0N6_PORTR|nr:hypothetical protein [Portunus trituberculatus]
MALREGGRGRLSGRGTQRLSGLASGVGGCLKSRVELGKQRRDKGGTGSSWRLKPDYLSNMNHVCSSLATCTWPPRQE